MSSFFEILLYYIFARKTSNGWNKIIPSKVVAYVPS